MEKYEAGGPRKKKSLKKVTFPTRVAGNVRRVSCQKWSPEENKSRKQKCSVSESEKLNQKIGRLATRLEGN